MTAERKPKESPDPRAVKEKVQSGDPTACVDEGQSGKSRDKQREDSRLEVGRPKDSGRCGA
jgi:hypothetical protein